MTLFLLYQVIWSFENILIFAIFEIKRLRFKKEYLF